MLEELITRLLKDYLIDYLDNFDKNSLNISFLKGVISLQNLQLNNKILDNIPIPLKMKYGRIGSIKIELPSVWQLTTGANFKIGVTVSDVFLCLESRPMNEWSETTIIEEFHQSKQKTLDTYEEDARFFYIQQKGDDEQMNKFVLQIIQNLKLTIERVYVRIEDPLPFAIGILIPLVQVHTADKEWNIVKVVEKPEIAYKMVRIEDLSIFMERDMDEADINDILKIKEIQDRPDFIVERERRIFEHIQSIFTWVKESQSDDIELDSNDFILKQLCIDVRLQMTIDKVRAKKNIEALSEPDMKVQIICGGFFGNVDPSTSRKHLQLQIREDQINAVTGFLSVTGLFNTYRLGVLKSFYEGKFVYVPESDDNKDDPAFQTVRMTQEYLEIERYISYYEEYQRHKVRPNSQAKLAQITAVLSEIELKYRADVIIQLRKAINERFYGFQRTEQMKIDELRKVEQQANPVMINIEKSLLVRIMERFDGEQHEEIIHHAQLSPAELGVKRQQIKFMSAFLRQFYKARFLLQLDVIKLIALDQYDPSLATITVKENSSMDLHFELPKLTLQLYSSKTDHIKSTPIMMLAVEGLKLGMYNESKPEYLNMRITLKNFYIRDYNSPQPALPFIIQTILNSRSIGKHHSDYLSPLHPNNALLDDSHMHQQHESINAMEIEFEVNPKGNPIFSQRLKCHSFGQLYIYLNLEFTRHLIEFTQRVLQNMNVTYKNMVDQAPVAIQEEISKGSYYQRMMEKMISNKHAQLKKQIDKYTKGTYETPKIDLDIYFISPKLIIHESLLSSEVQDVHNLAAVIIDLGRIDVKTHLVRKEINVDYTQETDAKLLYDSIQVKFGKLKISADYKLRLSSSNTQISDKILNWGHSYYQVDITNEINFGFEMKTCITAFHESYPAQIINVKFEQLILNVSRTVEKSLLKFGAIYLNGAFTKSLDAFLSADASEIAPVVEELAEQIIESEGEVKEAIKAIKIEVNFIFSRLEICIKEITLPIFDHTDMLQLSSKLKNPAKKLQIKNILEIGISSLKGKLILVPSESTTCDLFLRKLYVMNGSSMSHYKHILQHPFIEEDEEVAKHMSSKGVSIISQRYLGEFQSVNAARSIYQTNKDDQTPVDFNVFRYFNPEEEHLTTNNQLALIFRQVKDDTVIQMILQNMRLYFLVPEIKKVVRFYVDLTLDIKEFMKPKGNIMKPLILNKKPTPKVIEQQPDPIIKRTFTLASAYDKQDEIHQTNIINLRRLIKNAKDKKIRELEKADKMRKEKLKSDYGFDEIQRKVTMKINVEITSFEIHVPTDLYKMQSVALKIGTQVILDMTSESDVKEVRTRDPDQTVIESIETKMDSRIKVDVNNLQIYTEQVNFEYSRVNAFLPDRIYFLKPYNVSVDIKSTKLTRFWNETDTKSDIGVKCSSTFELQIGIREIQTYLLLGQTIFQLLNDINAMQDELVVKIEIPQLKNEHASKIIKPQTLDEILVNEGLIRKQISRMKLLWQKGLAKVLTLITQRHYIDSTVTVDFKGFQLQIIDNALDIDKSVTLLSIAVKNLSLKLNSRSYQNMKSDMMERWFKLDQLSKCYFSLRTECSLVGFYYNRNTFAIEPFIEQVPLQVRIQQTSPMSDTKQVITCQEMLNINFTYGLICNLQRTLINLMKFEKNSSKNESISDQLSPGFSEDHDQRIQFVKKQVSSCLRNSVIVKREASKKTQVQTYLLNNILEEDNDQVVEDHISEAVQKQETHVQFINKTGLEVKFSLSANKKNLNLANLQTDDCIWILPPQASQVQNFPEIQMQLEKANDDEEQYDKYQSTVKVDFAIQGFRMIKSVNIQKNGIFGYFLHNENTRKGDLFTGDRSGLSCIVRIQRDHEFIKVYFESSLVFMNDTKFDLQILAVEHTHPRQKQESLVLKSLAEFNAPLTWFTNQASIYQQQMDVKNGKLLFRDISDVCDPRIVDPFTDHSKVIKLDKAQYLCMEIYQLKTKTSVGQFLINFHPILTVTNLLFTDLYLTPNISINEDVHILKTNTSDHFYVNNPYENNKLILSYKESETQHYFNNEITLNLRHMIKNTVVGFKEGLYVELKLQDERDKNSQQQIYVVIEKMQEQKPLRNTENYDFGLRNKIYSRTKSLHFQVYFPYIAINKTPLKIDLIGQNIENKLLPFSSAFIRPVSDKLQIQVAKYLRSTKFEINTYGVSGTIQLKKDQIQNSIKSPDQTSMMNPSLDIENQNYLEIGTQFSLCSHPYSKTKIIKFLPKYIIVNNIDIPIVIKEQNSCHQISIMPGEQIYYNDGQDDDDKLMIRILNIETETRLIPLSAEQDSQSKQSTIHLHHEVQLSTIYGKSNDRNIWSYCFPLSKVDDFQLTVPNPNQLPPNHEFGWQTTSEKIFLRTNLTPAGDNEATLFIQFTKPYYPEYIFFNQTPNTIRVSHKSADKNINDVYLLQSKHRQAIILNPNNKDEDLLNIEIMDETQMNVLHTFTYEIDSLKLHFPNRNPQYMIATKLSGNLRFIHLITEHQRQEDHKKKLESLNAAESDDGSDNEDKYLEEQLDQFIEEEDSKNEEDNEEFKGVLPPRAYYVDFNGGLDVDGLDNDRERRIGLLGNDDETPGQQQTKVIMLISLKGIGISLVNADPQEIIYLSLYDISILQLTKYMMRGDVQRNRTKLDFKIMNFQLDNMSMRTFPVVIGPRKAFNIREYEYNQQTSTLEHLLKAKEQKEQEKQVEFLQFYIDHSITVEGKISSQRIKRLDIAIQEININFHQHVLNYVLQFVGSLFDLLSDDIMTEFMKSETLFNYERMMAIMSNIVVEEISMLDDVRLLKHQKSMHRLNNVIQDQPDIYDFNMESDEVPIFDKGIQGLRSKSMQATHFQVKTKEQVCIQLIPCRVVFDEGIETGMTKILVQEISIKALRIFLTFRIQNLERSMGSSGTLQALLNFISNFTNVSDASIYFSQIDIQNAYTTQQNIVNILSKHYITQGIQQIYKVLGATDIVGNPVGLINNLGRGVEELYSEPFKGALTGQISGVARGVGKGVKGFAQKSTYGVSNSVAKLSGTWYLGIKGLSGRQISETNLDAPHNIQNGLLYGTKGLGLEIVKGITGIVTVPAQRVKESGFGCLQITKGTFQGLFGVVSAPVTGVLKFMHSVSTGLKNFSGNERNLERCRYPRYFNDREIMQKYHMSLSHAYTVLNHVQDGQHKNETILFAYDISGYMDDQKERFKDRILLCTDHRVLCVHNIKQIQLHIKLKDLKVVSIDDKDTRKIIFKTIQGKTHVVETEKPHKNDYFVNQLGLKLLPAAHDQLNASTFKLKPHSFSPQAPFKQLRVNEAQGTIDANDRRSMIAQINLFDYQEDRERAESIQSRI